MRACDSVLGSVREKKVWERVRERERVVERVNACERVNERACKSV